MLRARVAKRAAVALVALGLPLATTSAHAGAAGADVIVFDVTGTVCRVVASAADHVTVVTAC